MKDKKVSTKITMSFTIVIALTLLVGFAGVIGMVQINRGSIAMYASQSQPLADLGMAREYFQRLRVQLRDTVLASGDLDALSLIEADLYNHERGFLKNMEAYRQTIDDPNIIELYYDIMFIFAVYQPSMQQIIASARAHAPPVQMILMMDDLVVPTDFITEALDYLAYARVRQAAFANDMNRTLFNALFFMIAVVILLCVGVGVFITKNVAVLSKLEFARLADENAALESLSRMKSKYLANISHETKTPLAIISSNVQLAADIFEDMKMDNKDGKLISEALRFAQETTLRVGRISDNNLRLAAMQEIQEKMSEVNIARLIKGSTEMNRRTIEQKGTKLSVTIPDDLPTVCGNADNLNQVLDNLIANAYAHMAGGEIMVQVESESGIITVSITDSGEGISPELLPTVFNRGITGPNGGTGLGLSICKQIIEAHGGKIWLDSPVANSKGTKVTFTIPVYKKEEGEGYV
ncbi:MAG: ATP-binding protein [Oscillospiraceae bacterium]|nr:ATP-binding protein [Oscillospiraceae bacterium]